MNKKNKKNKKLKEINQKQNTAKKVYNYKPLVTVDLKSRLSDYSFDLNINNFEEELVAYATCASGSMYCV